MGKRSRTRAQAATGAQAAGRVAPRSPSTKAAGRSSTAPSPARSTGRVPAASSSRGRLDPTRRTLTAYLIAALAVAVLTLVGILVLGGRLGPFITLAVVVLAAGLIHRWAAARLARAPLTNEDRMMQTMAGGMLVLSVVLAAAGALVSTLA